MKNTVAIFQNEKLPYQNERVFIDSYVSIVAISILLLGAYAACCLWHIFLHVILQSWNVYATRPKPHDCSKSDSQRSTERLKSSELKIKYMYLLRCQHSMQK